MRHLPLIELAAGVWIVREQANLNFRSRSFLNVRSRAFATTVPRSTLDSKLLLNPSGKGNIMSMKLYVGNLSFGTTEDDLHQLFSQVGTVDSATMVTDRDTGRSRGFDFVEMSSKSEDRKSVVEGKSEDRGGVCM